MTLTPKQVHEIRERRASGDLVKVLAHDFGVSHSTISDVTYGRTYRYVHGALPKPPSPRPVTPEEAAQMRSFVASGGSTAECMHKFGRMRETVLKHAVP